jgi:hypothetical protein
MSRRLGLDVDQMNQLVKVLTAEAQQLEATVKNVTAKVQSVWWEGPLQGSGVGRARASAQPGGQDAPRRGCGRHAPGARPGVGLIPLTTS